MKFNELLQQLEQIKLNDQTGTFGSLPVWAESDAEGYRFEIKTAKVNNHTKRIMLIGD